MDKKNKIIFLIFFILTNILSLRIEAQTISKEFRDESLRTVLKEVERQTKMSIIYNLDDIDINRKITLILKNEYLREALKRILYPDNTFEISGKIIIIKKNIVQKHNNLEKKFDVEYTKIFGRVTDNLGDPMIGVSVKLKNSSSGTITNINGEYAMVTMEKKPLIEFSYIGYISQTLMAVTRNCRLDVIMVEDSTNLQEVVVTAMGIRRKEKSLTYATQQIKSNDFMKVEDTNLANNLVGKISGITINPNAGGVGGASKIVLRGAKSIIGNSSPLIVIDGIPLTNCIRNQIDMYDTGKLTYASTSEGNDPLSLINPADIESINVLKGANAAALYGSVAANGVIMITTKKGKKGKLTVNFLSNMMMERPLLLPNIQNIYGASIDKNSISLSSWGQRVSMWPIDKLMISFPIDDKFGNIDNEIHLRNETKNDIKDFFRTGFTTINSISLSGGTEKICTYFSYANAHFNGMIHNNSYNRNTFYFRQTYDFIKNISFDLSINYAQTITNNRIGGGTVLNPIYHMYTMPRNIDLEYYRKHYKYMEGHWMSEPRNIYVANTSGGFDLIKKSVSLNGPRQEWVYLINGQNNPYWLTKMNSNRQLEDKINISLFGEYKILTGLVFQSRLNLDRDKYNLESKRYATTFLPASMEDFGRFWKDISKTDEIYTDYLLTYYGNIAKNWNVTSTIGAVGHLITGDIQKTNVEATYIPSNKQMLSDRINLFMTNAGDVGATKSKSISNWDRAVLFTGEIYWKDKVFIDGSYRRDWYRAFRQFKKRGTPDNYGYFGIGANAILSSILHFPTWISYAKYRLSYSEVGNSIPNIVYAKSEEDLETGSLTVNPYSRFKKPIPEKTKSFETGVELSFLGSKLHVDLTYYNATVRNLYMTASNASQKIEPINSGKIRNKGFEGTLSYDFNLNKKVAWHTSYNISFNDNIILETSFEQDGSEKRIFQDVANVRVRYNKGGSIGDMYVTDFKRDEKGKYILTNDGKTQIESEIDKQYTLYVGNMNPKWKMGWSNDIKYKNFYVYFLINGSIGGKVISLTESYLDKLGLSKRSGNARIEAEKLNLLATNYNNQLGMILPDGSCRVVPIKAYYESIGEIPNASKYIYDASNFRLREFAFGYTFRDLIGKGRNLTLSFIARNLFFIYRKSPTDPDISLSTQNGLGGFELFNMPSSRSYGLSLQLNY